MHTLIRLLNTLKTRRALKIHYNDLDGAKLKLSNAYRGAVIIFDDSVEDRHIYNIGMELSKKFNTHAYIQKRILYINVEPIGKYVRIFKQIPYTNMVSPL